MAEDKPSTSPRLHNSLALEERASHGRACKRQCERPSAADQNEMTNEMRSPNAEAYEKVEVVKSPLSPLNGVPRKQGHNCLKSPRQCLSPAKGSIVPRQKGGHSNQENVAPPLPQSSVTCAALSRMQ